MKTSIYLLIVATLIGFQSQAQCNRSSSLEGTFNILGGTCGSFSSIFTYSPGRYFRMPVYSGGSYTVQTCNSTMDTQITAYEPPNTVAGTHFAYNDNNGPICGAGSQRASVVMTPTFTGFAEIMVSEFNCSAGGSSSITVGYRQNNNLTITSSAADMCEGDVRALTATPARAASAVVGAGDQGSFSGIGVSGTNFTAPTPAGSSQTYTVTYTFGICSTNQNITVYRPPSASNAGPDQTVLIASTTLAGNTPAIGTGAWSIVSGPGTVTTPSDPASTITGLIPGNSTVVRWTITNGPCPAETDDVIINASAGLPIELLYFDARVRENSIVDLTWETASELDNDYFTVERSQDLENWTMVEKINGAGNSTTTLHYSTIDYNSTPGVWYYRLKQTDFDGQFTHSGVKSIEIFPFIDEMKIYPNPAENYVNVEGNPVEIATVRLFDVQGKEIQVDRICNGGKCKLMLDGLKPGMYMVRSKNHVFRVLKK